ncbi:hypothetical protein K493DRAFT_354726 [Basidiobolus meristosporus CBS 931.73]|uniref:Rad60/SUMO-like domain-containing protein n=1 Tax=Basidiobolus meristosporus CBS 931.73 TaxID=1314790 RepID=A0A1Y1Y2K4_9FUNG|nr:hypothetical protein K493DRAFT_354726 [Basidiobolus meristosporus CBS 931.73]|eukprot:ORX92247.1 hypothetical protein K493DRAFT_354726 [Basidiobolus meristosporus CBS 931.73]
MTTPDKIVLTFNEVRVFPHATPQSLGLSDKVKLAAYSKEHFELTQTQKKRRLKKELGECLEEQIPALTIRLKHKDKDVEHLRVKKTTKLKRIVETYRHQKTIDSTVPIELCFDGVKLNPELTLEETEIEDGDLVFVAFENPT